MDRLSGLNRIWDRGRWELARLARPWIRDLGWGGVGGGALLLAALVLGGLSLGSAAQQRALEQELASLPEAAAQPRSETFDYEARLRAFDAFLLPTQDIPRVVEGLLALATAKQLVLKTGEYRLEVQPGATFAGYRITLPVVGHAGAVQDFLLSALRRNKTLALESVNFKRPRIEASGVEARVNFVLLTRAPVAQGAAGQRR